MNKKNIGVGCVIISIVFIVTIFCGRNWSVQKSSKNNLIDNKSLTFMLETEDNSGQYKESTSSKWPDKDYVFNEDMSKCLDSLGNEITNQISFKNGELSVKVNKTTHCYMYFDKNVDSTITVNSTNNVMNMQTVSFEMIDKDKIISYYYGLSNPSIEEVEYINIDEVSTFDGAFYVRAPGTYYFSVKDTYGKITTVNKKFFQTKLSVTNGTVEPTSVITLEGNSFKLPTPTAKTGYTISSTWQGDGKTYNNGSEYKPTSDLTLTSTSSQNKYNVTLSITNGTTTSVNPQSVLHGSSASFAITPNTGYDLVLASDTCSGKLSGSTYTVSNVTSAKSCAITLKKKTYSVKITVTNGSTSSTNPQTVEHGGSAKFKIAAKSGYRLALSSNGCGGTLSGSTYTISNVTSAKTCTIVLKTALAGDAIRALKPTGLETTVKDGLYRFVGSSVNNYVCLGTCASDNKNKYRIIGITDGSTLNTNLGLTAGQLKLKSASAITVTSNGNTHAVMSVANVSADWSTVELKGKVNGTSFLTNTSYIPSGWSDKISSVKWYSGKDFVVSGSYSASFNKYTASAMTSSTYKIGLIYIVDYAHSAGSTGTTLTASNSWMYADAGSYNWWTMEFNDKNTSHFRYYGRIISSTGDVSSSKLTSPANVFPVFYLKSTVTYTGTGNGTSSSPYILN